jgi:hypothetical protein
VDLALIMAQGAPPERVKPFVEEADSSSRFADPQGKRIAYAVVAAGKGGVFLVEVP